MKKRITLGQITAFRQHLLEEEREPATIEKYLRDVSAVVSANILPDNPSTPKRQRTCSPLITSR